MALWEIVYFQIDTLPFFITQIAGKKGKGKKSVPFAGSYISK